MVLFNKINNLQLLLCHYIFVSWSKFSSRASIINANHIFCRNLFHQTEYFYCFHHKIEQWHFLWRKNTQVSHKTNFVGFRFWEFMVCAQCACRNKSAFKVIVPEADTLIIFILNVSTRRMLFKQFFIYW